VRFQIQPPAILLIKKTDDDSRFARVPELLTTRRTIEAADSQDHDGFPRGALGVDAIVSMNWPSDMPPATRPKLLQLPGAGIDEIALDAVPEQATVCNVFKQETGISECVLETLLQWFIPIPNLKAALRGGEWRGSHLNVPKRQELFGRIPGSIAYRRIGRNVAKRVGAFGMRVLARNRDRLALNELPLNVVRQPIT
jgi:phosphoglycerate dehydrogenase-like enzyme